jgi:hypothetical protein
VRGWVVTLVCVESYIHLTGLSLHSNERGQPLGEGGSKAENGRVRPILPCLKTLVTLNRFPPHVISETTDYGAAMDIRDLRTLESWRRTVDQALQETDAERNVGTHLQAVYLEGLRDAIDRTIGRIRREYLRQAA